LWAYIRRFYGSGQGVKPKVDKNIKICNTAALNFLASSAPVAELTRKFTPEREPWGRAFLHH
jgi:hypothetical protein